MMSCQVDFTYIKPVFYREGWSEHQLYDLQGTLHVYGGTSPAPHTQDTARAPQLGLGSISHLRAERTGKTVRAVGVGNKNTEQIKLL